jgi:thiol-disulfide isomerase/thioredoxin
MFNRRAAIIGSVLAATIGASVSFAIAADGPLDKLAAAQKAGQPVLVEITAPWCPTCRAQKSVLSELGQVDRFKRVVRIDVDFDNQKPAVRTLNASMQSTLIMYKGNREVGRLVGETNKAAIESLLSKAL